MTTASIPPSDDNTPATRGDLRHLETALRRDMDRLRADMDKLENSMRADLRSLNNSFNMLSVVIVGSAAAAVLALILD